MERPSLKEQPAEGGFEDEVITRNPSESTCKSLILNHVLVSILSNFHTNFTCQI